MKAGRSSEKRREVPPSYRGHNPEALLELKLKLQGRHGGEERRQEHFVAVAAEVPPLRYVRQVLQRASQVAGRVVVPGAERGGSKRGVSSSFG